MAKDTRNSLELRDDIKLACGASVSAYMLGFGFLTDNFQNAFVDSEQASSTFDDMDESSV